MISIIYKKKVSITLDPEVVRKYHELCDLMGYKISTRIELLMTNDIMLHQEWLEGEDVGGGFKEPLSPTNIREEKNGRRNKIIKHC
jgi:hypothetical protein